MRSSLVEHESLEKTSDPSVRLHTSVSLLAHAETVLSERRESVDGDRTLTLSGNLHLPELRAEIAFHHHGGNGNGRGSHENHRAIATIVARHYTMPTPLQHLAPPAREGNDVWMRTPAPERDPTWIEHYVGQFQGEPLTLDLHIPVEVTLDVTFAPEESKNGETKVHVTGALSFERSTSIRFLFREPEDSMESWESDGEAAVLIVPGSRIAVPSQTIASMAGRNSRMAVRVVDAERRVLCVSEPHL